MPVINPITAIVTNIPIANKDDNKNAFLIVTLSPWAPTNPTIRGIDARWQGLIRMLQTPHKKDAVIEI